MMKQSRIIGSIIGSRHKNIYVSDSVLIKRFDKRIYLAILLLAILFILLGVALLGNFIAVLSTCFFDRVPDNYNVGKGTLVFRSESRGRRSSVCSGTIRVYANRKRRDMEIHNLSCSARVGEVIRFIYPKDNPSKIMIADGHADFSILVSFSIFIIPAVVFFLINLLWLIIIRIRRLNTVKSPDTGPLSVKLEKYANCYERSNGSWGWPSIISDLGPQKTVYVFFVKYVFFDKYVYWNYEKSGFKTLVYKKGSKVSHIYGISENELRKFAGLPLVSFSRKEPERRFYFAGPWISSSRPPEEYMNIWFAEGMWYDYFMKPLNTKENAISLPKRTKKHTKKKNNNTHCSFVLFRL